MSQETLKGIWILTDETPNGSDADGAKSGIDIGADYDDHPAAKAEHGQRRSHVKAQDLKQNVSEFLEVVEEAFDQAEKPRLKMQLYEIELSVEINGEGQVNLLGTGGKVGTKGAIKLKFKRKDF